MLLTRNLIGFTGLCKQTSGSYARLIHANKVEFARIFPYNYPDTHSSPSFGAFASTTTLKSEQNCIEQRNNLIQIRKYSNLPSKDQVEKYTFKVIAKSIDLGKKILDSDGFHYVKQTAWNICLWMWKMFKRYVLDNPKVHSAINNFQKKIEAARHQK